MCVFVVVSRTQGLGANPRLEQPVLGGLASVDMLITWRGETVAVEVDGPHHFAANVPHHPLGSTVARNRSLQGVGVKLACVHFVDWVAAGSMVESAGGGGERTVAGGRAPPVVVGRSARGRSAGGSGGGGATPWPPPPLTWPGSSKESPGSDADTGTIAVRRQAYMTRLLDAAVGYQPQQTSSTKPARHTTTITTSTSAQARAGTTQPRPRRRTTSKSPTPQPRDSGHSTLSSRPDSSGQGATMRPLPPSAEREASNGFVSSTGSDAEPAAATAQARRGRRVRGASKESETQGVTQQGAPAVGSDRSSVSFQGTGYPSSTQGEGSESTPGRTSRGRSKAREGGRLGDADQGQSLQASTSEQAKPARASKAGRVSQGMQVRYNSFRRRRVLDEGPVGRKSETGASNARKRSAGP